MQALPGTRIDVSIADPVIDQASVILRAILENTISYARSGDLSCNFTSGGMLSPSTEKASLETVWLDADKHHLSDATSKPLCNVKDTDLACHVGDMIGHNIKTLVLPFNIVSKTPPPPTAMVSIVCSADCGDKVSPFLYV